MAQRHEQPVAYGQLSGNIADYARNLIGHPHGKDAHRLPGSVWRFSGSAHSGIPSRWTAISRQSSHLPGECRRQDYRHL
jgi:hypothetical protein